MNHPTQEQFEVALSNAGFVRSSGDAAPRGAVEGFDSPGSRHEPPAERRDCDEMPLGVPRG